MHPPAPMFSMQRRHLPCNASMYWFALHCFAWWQPLSPIVAVRYCLYNEDKSQTLKESPQGGAEFVLKEGVAVPALPIALKTMKKDEKVSLILKPGCELLVSISAIYHFTFILVYLFISLPV